MGELLGKNAFNTALVKFPSQVFFNHPRYERVTLGLGPLDGNASLCGMLPHSMWAPWY